MWRQVAAGNTLHDDIWRLRLVKQADKKTKHVVSGWPWRGLDHVDVAPARGPHGRVRWTEEGHGGTAGRGGEVGDAAIVAEVEAGSRQAARQGDEGILL